MLRSVYYPLICMAVSAIVLGQLAMSMGAVMNRAAALPAMLSQVQK